MPADTIPATGVLTFLFTDVQGSTRLWADDADGMSASLRSHDELLRSTIDEHRGHVFTTAGDAFCAAFGDPADAVRCATNAAAALEALDWPGPSLRVRMGLHRGPAESRDGDYFGPTLNAAARIGAAGHGGQIVVSDEVRNAVPVPTVELGTFRLRDVPGVVRLHQLGDGIFPPLRVVPETLSFLPTPATPLVGRVEEVRAIRSLLIEHRLVTITGTGGAGKTRLAIEVADRELAHFAHGAYFADLSNVADDDVVLAVADALRLHLTGGDPLAQLLAYLSDKQSLIVLDNCEHLVEACADLAEAMLASAGDWRIVATSREHLRVQGEQVFRAPALDVSDRGAAVELFTQRAMLVQPGFVVDDTNREALGELCRHLDGMPLAIELAAARIEVMTPAEMLQGLDDRFRLLSGGRGRARRSHGTLEATLSWSYELLDGAERPFFQRLGVLTGPFDAALAAAVADVDRSEALETLDSLVGKSLVAVSHDGERTLFHLLETLRAYALGQLVGGDGELAAARDRHLDHHVAALAETVSTAGSWIIWDWRTVCRWLAVTPNLEAAIDWAIERERFVDAGEMLAAATPVWREQLRTRAIIDRIDAVTGVLPTVSDLRERLLIPEMPCAMALGDLDRLQAFFAGASGLRNETAREFHRVLGANATAMTDPATSLALADEAAAASDDPFVFWDKNRADIHLFAGEYDAAVAVLRPLQGANLWAVIDGTIAIGLLMGGRPAEALRIADDHPMQDSIRMSFGLIAGLCHLALGDEQSGARELIAVGRSAALGRMSLRANTALVGIAALVHHRGDVEWAREIILGARCQREVAINALARMVADQIGVRVEFIDQQVAAAADMASNDQTAFLRETLARLDDAG